ncbi:DUF1127 domain-containing protein [Primorskyibacter sp. S187A]|uniref:DUF1127 domain-containing protein n=1 Tax=Primorskyibacter sp. S187A TaxID=3415130 RepID=UPI003C7A5099
MAFTTASHDFPVAKAAQTQGHRAGLWAILSNYAGLLRQRQSLAKLDDAALRDIGLTRHEADEESKRPFWDLPKV